MISIFRHSLQFVFVALILIFFSNNVRADFVFGPNTNPSSANYGNLTLLPDTADQVVPITINSMGCVTAPSIGGLDLRLQIGDGGDVLGGTDVGAPNAGANLPGMVSFEGFDSGPAATITSASSIFLGGSLTGLMANSGGTGTEAFSGHGSLTNPLQNNLFGGWNLITGGGTVAADGLIGNLVMDTTGITTATPFSIVISNSDIGFETVLNPGMIEPCGIVPGSFTVAAIPEPSAFLFLIIAASAAYAWARRPW